MKIRLEVCRTVWSGVIQKMRSTSAGVPAARRSGQRQSQQKALAKSAGKNSSGSDEVAKKFKTVSDIGYSKVLREEYCKTRSATETSKGRGFCLISSLMLSGA